MKHALRYVAVSLTCWNYNKQWLTCIPLLNVYPQLELYIDLRYNLLHRCPELGGRCHLNCRLFVDWRMTVQNHDGDHWLRFPYVHLSLKQGAVYIAVKALLTCFTLPRFVVGTWNLEKKWEGMARARKPPTRNTASEWHVRNLNYVMPVLSHCGISWTSGWPSESSAWALAS